MVESFQKCCTFHLSHSGGGALHKSTWEENLASRVSPWRAGVRQHRVQNVHCWCPISAQQSLTAASVPATSADSLYGLEEEPCAKPSTSSFFPVYIIHLFLSFRKSMIFPSGLQTLCIQTCSSHLLVILDNKEKTYKSLTTGIYWPGQGARELKT